MSATINPRTLSKLLGEIAIGTEDVQGFLWGKLTPKISVNIGDNVADRFENTLELNISGFQTNEIGFDPEDDEDLFEHRVFERMRDMGIGGDCIVGWFRYNSEHYQPLHDISENDSSTHEMLREALPEDLRATFVFLRITKSCIENIDYGMVGFDRTLFRLNTKKYGEVERIKLTIPNLGHTDATARYLPPLLDCTSNKQNINHEKLLDAQSKHGKQLRAIHEQSVKECSELLNGDASAFEEEEAELLAEIYALELKFVETFHVKPQKFSEEAKIMRERAGLTTPDPVMPGLDTPETQTIGDTPELDIPGLDTPIPETAPQNHSSNYDLFDDGTDMIIPETQLDSRGHESPDDQAYMDCQTGIENEDQKMNEGIGVTRDKEKRAKKRAAFVDSASDSESSQNGNERKENVVSKKEENVVSKEEENVVSKKKENGVTTKAKHNGISKKAEDKKADSDSDEDDPFLKVYGLMPTKSTSKTATLTVQNDCEDDLLPSRAKTNSGKRKAAEDDERADTEKETAKSRARTNIGKGKGVGKGKKGKDKNDDVTEETWLSKETLKSKRTEKSRDTSPSL